MCRLMCPAGRSSELSPTQCPETSTFCLHILDASAPAPGAHKLPASCVSITDRSRSNKGDRSDGDTALKRLTPTELLISEFYYDENCYINTCAQNRPRALGNADDDSGCS